MARRRRLLGTSCLDPMGNITRINRLHLRLHPNSLWELLLIAYVIRYFATQIKYLIHNNITMESLDLEKKYIEERIRILQALRKHFGDSVIEIAARAKKKLMGPRIHEKYKKELPVNMQRFFEIIFGDFEGINRVIDFEVIKKTDKELEVKMNECWYAEIYRTLKAADIGEKLVCDMDSEMNKALNPKIKMERPKKLMCGDDYCIFKYRLEE